MIPCEHKLEKEVSLWSFVSTCYLLFPFGCLDLITLLIWCAKFNFSKLLFLSSFLLLFPETNATILIAHDSDYYFLFSFLSFSA